MLLKIPTAFLTMERFLFAKPLKLPPVLLRCVPVFLVSSIDRTIAFYAGKLGFERNGPNGVRRDTVELQFATGVAAGGGRFQIQVSEIEKLHRELLGSDCRAGIQEFELIDCNGLKLIFSRVAHC